MFRRKQTNEQPKRDAPQPRPVANDQRRAAPPLPLPTPALLVLCADPQFIALLQEALTQDVGRGAYRVEYVEELADLWQAVEEEPWDALLIDAACPAADDLTTRDLHQLGRSAPCIALLGGGAPSDEGQRELAQMGYAAWLPDQFTGRSLHETLERLLTERRARNAQSSSRPLPSGAQRRPAGGEPVTAPLAAPPPEHSRGPKPVAPMSAPSAVPTQLPLERPLPPRTAPVPAAPDLTLVPESVLLACWAPFADVQMEIAALNLAYVLAERGVRVLLGEVSRPSGALSSLLGLADDDLSHSLLAAAAASRDPALSINQETGKAYTYPELLQLYLLHRLDVPRVKEDRLHFFVSGPPDNAVRLFEEPALQGDPPPFVERLLAQLVGRPWWNFSLLLVGSNLADPLHLAVLTRCRRLLVCLSPDPEVLARAEALLPELLSAVELAPEQVDVVLTQADRGLVPAPGLELLGRQGKGEESRALARMQEGLKQLPKERTRREAEVRALLSRCGLPPSALVGLLPDALPQQRQLHARMAPAGHERWPLARHPDFAARDAVRGAYTRAIEQLANTWMHPGAQASAGRR